MKDDEIAASGLPEIPDKFWDDSNPELTPEANLAVDNHEWVFQTAMPVHDEVNSDGSCTSHLVNKFECRKCGINMLTAVGEAPSQGADFSCHDRMIRMIDITLSE